jgi:hypothetical protein
MARPSLPCACTLRARAQGRGLAPRSLNTAPALTTPARSARLQRKWGYFLNNILLPVGSITVIAPLSAATEPDGARMGTGDRLAYALTLLLTAVAYKLALASAIPQVSYLTLVDVYTLVCFGFMWLNLVEAAIWPSAGYVLDGPEGEPVEVFSEWYYLAVYVGLFLLYNGYFVLRVHAILSSRARRREATQRRLLVL